ncbi:MAG: hypothetical protein U0T73_13020, partial [Chitinophagales bacterium]
FRFEIRIVMMADAALSAASPQAAESLKPLLCSRFGRITNFKLRITKEVVEPQTRIIILLVIRNFLFVIFSLRPCGLSAPIATAVCQNIEPCTF